MIFLAGKMGGSSSLSVSNGGRFFWVSKIQVLIGLKQYFALCKPGGNVFQVLCNQGQNIKKSPRRVQSLAVGTTNRSSGHRYAAPLNSSVSENGCSV